jgi:membrane-bound metal-dependent hydrolase YbcI (DUF457 family)
MGPTHALSAVAAMLAVVAFLPDVAQVVFTPYILPVIVAAGFVTAGASLIPDLDNTTSTSKNTLGVLGIGLSAFFRVSSAFLQTVIRTRRDDSSPDPHRGAWHTVPAALLLGFLTWLATTIPGEVTIPGLERTVTWGYVAAFILATTLTHLALAGLAGSAMRKVKKSGPLGELIALLISVGIMATLFFFMPTDVPFIWLGVAVAFGCFIHTLGDCFTTAGAPILFPLSGFIKKKFWWNTRFTSIRAGGPAEVLFVIVFVVVIIISLIRIGMNL